MYANRTSWRVAAIVAVTTLALAGCGGGSGPAATETVDPDVSASKTAPPDPEIPPIWPLTGIEGTPESRPAVTVKIENSTAARPQTGLESADIVWEELVEGGITRFAAMYHSQVPEQVGPIRSIRPMDGPIAAPTHGLIAFSGGITKFVQIAKDAGLQTLSQDEGSKGFSRVKGRKAPHNVYGNVATFLSQADADHSAVPQQLFGYAAAADQASAVAGGTPANTLSLQFSQGSRPGWTWDAGSGLWQRDESGKAAVSAAGARLSAVNIVIMRVEVVNSGQVDPAGNPVPETKVVGSGEVTVATGGQVISGNWEKTDNTSGYRLTTADGTEILLAPGQSWVELVPVSTGEAGLVVG